MKHTLITTFFLAMAGSCLCMAAEPAAKPSEATEALVKAAQALGRDRNANVEAVSNAFVQAIAASDLPGDQVTALQQGLANVFVARDRLDVAAAILQQAVGDTRLAPAQKAALLTAQARILIDGNFKGAFASYHTDGIDRACLVYLSILEIPDIANATKIEAWLGIADCHFERMEVDKANEALANAANLPGLDAQDRWTARYHQAVGFQRQLDYAAALAIFETLWSEDLHVHKRTELEGRITTCLVELGRISDVLPRMTAWKRNPVDIARFHFETLEDDASARKLVETVLADSAADFALRSKAAELLLQIRAKSGNVKSLIAEAGRVIPKLAAENPKGWNLYGAMNAAAFTRFGLHNDPEFRRWLSERILETPDLPAADFVKQQEPRFQDAVKRHDPAAAKAVTTAILAREGIQDAVRAKFGLAMAVLESGANSGAVVGRVDRALKGADAKGPDSAARAAGLLQAAQMAFVLGFEDSARTLYDAREKMLVKAPLRSMSCTFIENGPSDISAFLASAYFKDARNRARLDRKYGDNLQFLLETDSALTGRKVTEQAAEFRPTEFVATCDADGVKLFFFAPTDKAKEIAEGFSTLGGYELYLAAGPDEPYHCYLVNQVPGDTGDSFVTQYDNANFRRARQDDGAFTIQHQILDNGVATLIAFSWKAFFNRLPADGDAWSFEALHWEQGGYSWGGSQSVHNRSSFGSLVFANLTEANRRAIKRRLIPAAAAVYRNEIRPANGCVEIWEDPELGDRDFFSAAIKPLRETLDGYLKQVAPTMTDAEVDLLFDKAVPQWMNIKYVVADLRRAALAERRISGK